jgi:hypothetical protein
MQDSLSCLQSPELLFIPTEFYTKDKEENERGENSIKAW